MYYIFRKGSRRGKGRLRTRRKGDENNEHERHYKSALEEENQRLREENDRLMDIVVQMKGTLNRLVKAYITESK